MTKAFWTYYPITQAPTQEDIEAIKASQAKEMSDLLKRQEEECRCLICDLKDVRRQHYRGG